MESLRQQKVARLVQREVSEIFQQESILPKAMISVTQVRITPDLGLAKVYVSLFPSDDKDGDLEIVRKHSGEMRYKLGQRVRQQLRHVPELVFYLDDSLDYAERIDDLLK